MRANVLMGWVFRQESHGRVVMLPTRFQMQSRVAGYIMKILVSLMGDEGSNFQLYHEQELFLQKDQVFKSIHIQMAYKLRRQSCLRVSLTIKQFLLLYF